MGGLFSRNRSNERRSSRRRKTLGNEAISQVEMVDHVRASSNEENERVNVQQEANLNEREVVDEVSRDDVSSRVENTRDTESTGDSENTRQTENALQTENIQESDEELARRLQREEDLLASQPRHTNLESDAEFARQLQTQLHQEMDDETIPPFTRYLSVVLRQMQTLQQQQQFQNPQEGSNNHTARNTATQPQRVLLHQLLAAMIQQRQNGASLNSYEVLQRLEEMIGDAPRGASAEEINQLSVKRYIPPVDKETESCLICLEDYQEGDEVKVLPHCLHCYHVACIDKWLQEHKTCPSCRDSIFEQT